MIKRNFINNKNGLSVMQDAVLFIVMVSISGAVLTPALMSDTSSETSVEKNREEVVDETLLMLTSSRVEELEYTFAGKQIEALTGIDLSGDSLAASIINTILKHEPLHKTYADLIVEDLVSQIMIEGTRINIFTESFDDALNEELKVILDDFLGDRYQYQFSAKWRPVGLFSFGGDIIIGTDIPTDITTHVSRAYWSLPENFFSEWFGWLDDYINNLGFDNWLNLDESDIKNELKDLFSDIVYNGFGGHDSLLDTCIDYVFDAIQNSISSIFDEVLQNTVGNSLKPYLGFDLGEKLMGDADNGLMGSLSDFSNNINIGDPIGDALNGFKETVKDQAESVLSSTLDPIINSIVDSIVQATNVDQIIEEVNAFLKYQINVLRAEARLTIWSARG